LSVRSKLSPILRPSFRPSRARAGGASVELLESRQLFAMFANGIDSDNLGEGVWAWGLRSAMSNLGFGSNYSAYFNYVHNTQGAQYIIIKAADGGNVYNNPAGVQSYTTTVRNAAHAAGLKIFPYFYIRGTDAATLTAEINVFNSIVNSVGADGVVFDIEGDWDNFNVTHSVNTAERDQRIVDYFAGIGKSQAGNGTGSRDSMFMAYSSFPYVHLHGEVPFLKLGDYCDASMPQPYWYTLGSSPSSSSSRSPTKGQSLRGPGGQQRMVTDVDSEYRMMSLESTPRANIWNGHPESIKPVIMTGQMYNTSMPASEITEFYNAVINDTNAVGSGNVAGYRYKSINFFDEDTAGVTTQAQLDALNTLSIGDLPGTPATPSPSNSSNIASPGPTTLDWADVVNTYGSPMTGAATSYDVYIDGVFKSNLTTSSYSISPALSSGSHTWQIRANNIMGTTNGPMWSFNIVAPVAPPANVAASDGLFSNKIALSWDAAAGATKYQVYRSTINDPATGAPLLQTTSTTYDDLGASSNTAYYYWVAAVNSVNVVGSKGTVDSGFSDSIAPTTTPGGFQANVGPAYIDFTFNESVGGSVDANDLSFTNINFPGDDVPSVTSASWIGASNTARYFLNSAIPDGDFRATISGVNDPAGNAAGGTTTLIFSFLSGDANADRTVNALDFNALAAHFGNSGAGFSGGDFNLDNLVNSLDFNALASRFGTSLPPAPPPGLPASAALGSLFSASSIKQTDLVDATYSDVLPA
jgi:hypothetical protein